MVLFGNTVVESSRDLFQKISPWMKGVEVKSVAVEGRLPLPASQSSLHMK
jgi:hypothetical protein